MKKILQEIVLKPKLHVMWLNTLSNLEYSGARKITKFLPPNSASLEMLQHASEEFRHAWFFKKQISRLDSDILNNSVERSICFKGQIFRRYLDILDIKIAKWLKREGLKIDDRCYFLTTYAIEVRAKYLYELYESFLKGIGHKISVRTIIKEEINHLRIMEKEIVEDQVLISGAKVACSIEEELFLRFKQELRKNIFS